MFLQVVLEAEMMKFLMKFEKKKQLSALDDVLLVRGSLNWLIKQLRMKRRRNIGHTFLVVLCVFCSEGLDDFLPERA